jgi:hypothetical protein
MKRTSLASKSPGSSIWTATRAQTSTLLGTSDFSLAEGTCTTDRRLIATGLGPFLAFAKFLDENPGETEIWKSIVTKEKQRIQNTLISPYLVGNASPAAASNGRGCIC